MECLWPECDGTPRAGDMFCRLKSCIAARKAAGERGLTHDEYAAWGVWADHQKAMERAKNRSAAHKAAVSRYRTSEKGRAASRRNNLSEASRAAQRRYRQSEAGKQRQAAYRQSETYRERRARIESSPARRRYARRRYVQGRLGRERVQGATITSNRRLRQEELDRAVRLASPELLELIESQRKDSDRVFHERWGMMSLDAPVSMDGLFTLGDTVGVWDDVSWVEED